jgi:hypothetical protein
VALKDTLQPEPEEHLIYGIIPNRRLGAFGLRRRLSRGRCGAPAADHVGPPLGLKGLVDRLLDLGRAASAANVGDNHLTLVFSALAAGDSIDDAGALRAGGTRRILGFSVKASHTPGTFLCSFRWDHLRQLDAVSRHLLARARAAGAGPGSAPFTFDLDSTICETCGQAKEGAAHHGNTGLRRNRPLLAVAAGAGDVLMARLRDGRAHTARGAAPFLRETIGWVRHAGATGELTARANYGTYAHMRSWRPARKRASASPLRSACRVASGA